MPFDDTSFLRVTVPEAKPFDYATATGDERLLELARWLENEQEWRDHRLVWQYEFFNAIVQHDCGTAGCALGLADVVFPEYREARDGGGFFSVARAHFGLTQEETDYLFNGEFFITPPETDDDEPTFGATVNGKYISSYQDVEPGDIAYLIREFVAARNPHKE